MAGRRRQLPQRICRRQDQRTVSAAHHAGHCGGHAGQHCAGADHIDGRARGHARRDDGQHAHGSARAAGRGRRATRARTAGTTAPLPIVDGRVTFTAPPDGRWEIQFIRHVFRSSPTRYINRADGTYSKDSLYSLIDYLNPDATRAFLKTTHEVYKGLFGDEFGSTVLGSSATSRTTPVLPRTPPPCLSSSASRRDTTYSLTYLNSSRRP